jgi:hypothetical protein
MVPDACVLHVQDRLVMQCPVICIGIMNVSGKVMWSLNGGLMHIMQACQPLLIGLGSLIE